MGQWLIASDENLEHLQHYGTPGMKWGVRNYIDYNGTLTAAGRERYRANTTKYSQSKGLANRKKDIEDIRASLKRLPKGKKGASDRKALREQLKNRLASYRIDAKAERTKFQADKKAERLATKTELANLKDVNRYMQYNEKMAKSVEKASKFTELIGKYNKKKEIDIQKKKNSQAELIKSKRNENEKLAAEDIRTATTSEKVDRYREAMKNFKNKRRS